MMCNLNSNIYKLNIPREYLLSKLAKCIDGKLRSPCDAKMITLLNKGRPISEAIILTANVSAFPSDMTTILCKRYFKIAKTYIHDYNLTKKRNKHNQETT